MSIVKIVVMMSVVFSVPLYPCQISEKIAYRQATIEDAPGILNLINTHAIKDNDKIVVLPEAFRLQALQNGICKGRYFVAHDTSAEQIIAYKKLFLLQEEQEQKEVLEEELRLQGYKSTFVDDNTFLCNAGFCLPTLSVTTPSIPTLEQCLYIYTGGDFTHPEHRSRGINSALTDYALSAVQPAVQEHLLKNKVHQLALVYGLTHLNDYGLCLRNGTSRTPHIADAFARFIILLQPTKKTNTIPILRQRFKSCMPTFDLHANECRPLPDDKAVAGYGNILLGAVDVSDISQ
mgnify:FL=1